MPITVTHATVATNPQDPLLDHDDWNANHVIAGTIEISDVDGLQTELDAKQTATDPIVSPNITARGDFFPLNVDSTNSNAYKIALLDNGTIRSYLGASSANALMVGDNAGVTKFTIQSNGNVGIGDGLVPARTLDINRNSTAISAAAGFPAMRIVNSNPTAGDGITTHNFCGIFVDSGNGTSVGTIRSGTMTGGTQPGNRVSIGSVTSVDVVHIVGNVEAARFNTARDLGIGESSPTAKLHVAGAIRCGSYTLATVPSASSNGAGAMIYITDEVGGAQPAWSDGTSWIRASDRSQAGDVDVGRNTYIQSTAPVVSAGTPYSWWDTTGGNLTLWIEDGV